MKELRIEMPEKTLIGKVYESWNELKGPVITHILSVFYAPLPQDWGEQARHWQNIQIMKVLNNWTDVELNEWREAAIIGYMLQFEVQDIKLAHDIWVKDLEIVLNESLKFAITVNTEDGSRTLNQTLYENPFPWLKIKDPSGQFVKWFSAFSDENDPFRDVTLFELGSIFTLYEQYHTDKHEEKLNELIAVVYRPEKSRHERQNDDSDDPRQPLESSQKKMRTRIAIVRKQVHPSIKKSITLHLTSAMRRFAELYPSVFSKKKKGPSKGGDFLDFVLELTDFDPQKSDAVFQRPAHDMFELAERLVIRNKAAIKSDD